MSYVDFFRRATGCEPFPYQRALGEGGLPGLLEAPTGAGKTAAVVLAWLWQRHGGDPERRSATARRLVYCLPMRVLVDQVEREVRRWVARLELPVGVHVLRGGNLDESWERDPCVDLILIGTQDQLLSRALNRGYAMSRFRWPVPFGLLHNDAWWVLDEVQLMGPGLRTAAQLDGLRASFSTFGPVGSTFMSATLRKDWLASPDFDPGSATHSKLEDVDWQQEVLRARTTAVKPLELAPVSEEKELATWIATQHEAASVTLIVVNRVARAQTLSKRLRVALPEAEHVLIHSRFRPAERKANEAKLHEPIPAAGRVVVATQTIEAGVDLSAHRLITDLAPWPSLVQRFGRCNRRGELEAGPVHWVDLDIDKKGGSAPYQPAALARSREILADLHDARIDGLPPVELEWPSTDLPRRRDIEGLFDTDPDLDGNFVDVSRWVRGEGSPEVQVYWREASEMPEGEAAPIPEELCSVPLEALRAFMKAAGAGPIWHWDSFEGRWNRAHNNASGRATGFISPGQTYLMDAKAGGYDEGVGWLGKPGAAVPVVEHPSDARDDHFGGDPRSQDPGGYVTLEVHLADTAKQARGLATGVGCLDDDLIAQVEEAAGWHDTGKAHSVFQRAAGVRGSPLMAKAPTFRRYERKGFRHELVSALLALRAGRSDLVAYLAAAHHGKVRVSLRPLQWASLEAGNVLRGVSASDEVPPVTTPSGSSPAAPPLPLALAEMGRHPEYGASWTDRVLKLLEAYGPFRLAYLEALVRVADWQASAEPSARWEAADA